MWRQSCLILAVGTALAGRALASPEAAEVNLDYVAKRAEERAQHPFHSPRADLPKVLRQDNLDYDKYREIEFRHEKALWAAEALPFRVEFFHPGYLYQEPVRMYEFTATHVQSIRFVQDFFNYRALLIQKQIPADTGYAGFRVLNQLNQTGKWDEVGAFLGESYFRLLGKEQRYGPSARGLALNCGETNQREEFPIFTDWWLSKPQKDDTTLTLYAILDSVSCAGAYQFLIRPGETTVADVEAVLYFREPDKICAADTNAQPVKTIGMAPLTSMFWFGKNSERKFDDYRPEVHDSDGLLMRLDNGDVLWRPLNNPPVMRHQIFSAPNIRGFGLLQRERSFSAYQDLFNFYQQVPTMWVEPRGNWGDGDLHLVELSANYEGSDNIVTFWDPKNKPAPLQPYRFGYTLKWTREVDMSLSANKVILMCVGLDSHFANARQFIIDFAGPKLDAVPENDPPLAIASCSTNAAVLDNFVLRNPFLGTWRVILKMRPKSRGTDPVDLRCRLQKGTNILSEIWTYQWNPP